MARVVENARRPHLLLAVLVLTHLAVISRQVDTGGGVTLLSRFIFNTFSPVQRAGAALVSLVSGTWNGYVALRHVREDNLQLGARVRYLETRLQERQEQVQEAERLRQLLELKQVMPLAGVVSGVIARDGVPWFRTVTLDKGTSDGVALDAPVISATGVVGRVVAVGPHAAKVQLLLDRESGVGARVERTRVAGVVVGQVAYADTGTYELLMRYVPVTADVVVGDVVVTSGQDQIFPRGLMLGRVASVSRGSGLFKDVTVVPSAGFERLEEVMVVRPTAPDTGLDQVLR
jgi:rod shape-determining protein MreC